MGRVDGKVALISGGASGLGAASARMLAREGARVVIGDVDLERGAALAGEIGPPARARKLDVTEPADWRAAVDDAIEAWGRLDVLVNSAGIVLMGSIEDATLDDF